MHFDFRKRNLALRPLKYSFHKNCNFLTFGYAFLCVKIKSILNKVKLNELFF